MREEFKYPFKFKCNHIYTEETDGGYKGYFVIINNDGECESRFFFFNGLRYFSSANDFSIIEGERIYDMGEVG